MYSKGFGVIEILVGVSILSIFLFIFTGVAQNGIIVARETQRKVKASFLLEEGVEAVRSMRDRSWTTEIDSITNNSPDYCSDEFDVVFSTSTNEWQRDDNIDLIDDLFYRSMTSCFVERDSNDDIVDSGYIDNQTIELTTSVSWQNFGGATSTEEVVIYLTNFFDN